MVSFRGQKSLATTPRSVSFRGLIQDFRRAFSPLSCEESPPGGKLPNQGSSGWKIKRYMSLCLGSFREYGLLP